MEFAELSVIATDGEVFRVLLLANPKDTAPVILPIRKLGTKMNG